MVNQPLSDRLAAVAVALLLILTAWGNAMVLLVVALLGVAVTLVFFRKKVTRGAALSATSGFVLAIAIALLALLR